jgi:hypothetical protein
MPPPSHSEHYRRFPGDRDCIDVPQPDDGLLHACGIALADAFPHTTAGSRPPLLAHLRSCIAKVAIFPRNARAARYKSGGRQPPVIRRSAFAMPPPSYSEHYRRFPSYRDCDDARQPSGDSLPHVCGIAVANAYPHTTAGSRPPLLRTCVRASQKSQFCRQTLALQGTRAEDVSTPWMGDTNSVPDESSTIQRHATDNQERGALAPRGSPKRIRNATARLLGTLPTLPRRPRLQ